MLLSLRILDTESREYRCNKNKQRRIGEMSPWADAKADTLSKPKC